jgi:hypothetical protein
VKLNNFMKKLKIGILTNNLVSPIWVVEALEALERDNVIEVSALIIPEEDVVRQRGKFKILLGSAILYRIYYLLDRFFSRVPRHPFNKVFFLDFFSEAIVVKVKTRKTRYREYFDDLSLMDIKALELDVLLCRGFTILSGDILRAAKYGVFSFHHGDNRINRGSPALFWEMYFKQKTAGVILQILTEELDNGIVLERSSTGIRSVSFSKNLSLHYWKSSKMLERSLRKLQKFGERYINDKKNSNSKNLVSFYCHPIYKHPSNNVVFFHVLGIIKTTLTKKIKSFFKSKEKWRIMISLAQDGRIETNLWKYKYLNIPSPNNVADPFVVYKDGYYYIYFEEWKLERGGFISCVKVDSVGEVLNYYKSVLSGAWHFSFPSTYEENDELYIIPEISESGKVIIYRCVNFPDQFQIHSEILTGVECFDPHIYKFGELYCLFVNQKENKDISSYEECFLYCSNSLEGPWTNELISPISSDIANSRPAGNILETNGGLFRVTQNCEERYGYAVNVNKIISMNQNHYEEESWAIIEPNFNPNIQGVHTFNTSHGCSVIDVCLKQ